MAASYKTLGEEDFSFLRQKMRGALLQRVTAEVPYVVEVQKGRTPFKDFYYKTWSIMGSHVTYMLGLPLFFWFGFSHFARHLTFLMAFGLILCNMWKDFLCLPRPTSPPVVRLSESHNLEFGFPSSHSVNALNFPLFAAYYYLAYQEGFSLLSVAVLAAGVLLVGMSISYSRIYCGMHCPTDILGGFAVGLALLAAWVANLDEIDEWIVTGDNVLLYCFTVMMVFLWVYPNPVSPTPSFDDSISFGFVCIGIVIGTSRMAAEPIGAFAPYPAAVSYSLEHLGLVSTLLRVVLGVACILVWRIVAKAVCKAVFPPLFTYFDYAAVFRNPPQNNDLSGEVKERKGPYRFTRFNAEVATKAVVYTGIGWLACDLAPLLFFHLGLH